MEKVVESLLADCALLRGLVQRAAGFSLVGAVGEAAVPEEGREFAEALF